MSIFLFSAIDCKSCGNLIWTGHTSSGISTNLDPKRLNLVDEIMAKLNGVRTYQIHRLGRTFEATPRVGARMTARNPIVLAAHQCRPFDLFGQEMPTYFGSDTLPPKMTTNNDGMTF